MKFVSMVKSEPVEENEKDEGLEQPNSSNEDSEDDRDICI